MTKPHHPLQDLHVPNANKVEWGCGSVLNSNTVLANVSADRCRPYLQALRSFNARQQTGMGLLKTLCGKVEPGCGVGSTVLNLDDGFGTHVS
jgi:hypothetical protein